MQWEPMKPEPPVTRTSSSGTDSSVIGVPHQRHSGRFLTAEPAAPVDVRFAAGRQAYLRPVRTWRVRVAARLGLLAVTSIIPAGATAAPTFTAWSAATPQAFVGR